MHYIWLGAGRVMAGLHSVSAAVFARLPAWFAGAELYSMGRAIGLGHKEAADILRAARTVAKLMAVKALADHRGLMSGKTDADLDRGIKASGYGKTTPRA